MNTIAYVVGNTFSDNHVIMETSISLNLQEGHYLGWYVYFELVLEPAVKYDAHNTIEICVWKSF